MLVIGLTGNVASGKSTVAAIWQSLGAVVLDADRMGHTVLESGSETLNRVVEEFGEDILADGCLDRKRLAAKVFEDEASLRKLNRLVHPVIGEEIRKRIEEERRSGTKVVVVDAPLIFEAEIEDEFDLVVVVDAPLERRLQWLSENRGLGRETALRIERLQMDPREKAMKADIILQNGGTIDVLQEAAKLLFYKILDGYRGK